MQLGFDHRSTKWAIISAAGGVPKRTQSRLDARTVLLTVIAMVCFAANSLLCRLALTHDGIDPASFTTVRVLSAAAMLTMIVRLRRHRFPRLQYVSPRSVAALLTYLIFFSFAYVQLSAGTGALILIGAVQLTMMSIAFYEGERFSPRSWAGLGLATIGLVFLVLPGVTAPNPLGVAAMGVSGLGWGMFSLYARGTDHPVEVNASNLLCCLIPTAAINVFLLQQANVTAAGLGLAIASGAAATGLGYVVWYLALRNLPATRAATVQLSVPILVALGDVIFLSEPFSLRLLLASVAMLSGLAIVFSQRSGDAWQWIKRCRGKFLIGPCIDVRALRRYKG
jgi:drug/metabolite transporter (DMT)-like permease